MSSHSDFKEESVNAHNHYRRKHNTAPVRWSVTLAKNAQNWADHLGDIGKMEHAHINTRKGEGENIYCGMGSRIDGQYATKQWYNEIKDYDFTAEPGFNMKTGHFTQVIWAASTEIGLGRAKSEDGMDFIVARYSPIGNIAGEFEENVKPPADHSDVSESDSESDEDDHQAERSFEDSSLNLEDYSEENSLPGYAIMFQQKRVVPDIKKFKCQTAELSILAEPVQQAYFRTRKHVYIQHGMTYIVIHGFYD